MAAAGDGAAMDTKNGDCVSIWIRTLIFLRLKREDEIGFILEGNNAAAETNNSRK